MVEQATRRGEFLGVDVEAYPRDFAVFVRYHLAAKRISARYPMLGSVSWKVFQRFLQSSQNDYRVRFLDSSGQIPDVAHQRLIA